MKVIIDRAHWGVGFKRSPKSRLLQFHNGQRLMCCLGFVAKSLGATDEQILDKHLPSVIVGEDLYWPKEMYNFAGHFAWQWQDFFARTNDNRDVDNDVREGWVQVGFKELFGFNVEFVGKYPE